MTNALQTLLFVVLLLSCSTLTESKRKSKASPKTTTTSSSSSASSSSSSSSKTSSNESPAAGEERRLELASKLSQFPVLALSDGNFSKYITSRPRDYWAILMFTALDPKYQCNICSMLHGTFKEVASLYQSQYSFLDDPAAKRLAFFLVDVDKARNKFDEMQLQTVPRLYVLPPREVGASKLKIGDFELDMRPVHEGPSGLMAEIEKLSSIKIVQTRNPRPLLLGISLFAVILALFVSAAAPDLEKALFWYQSRYLWVVVSMVCFSVGVSGSIFCVIRSAPMYGYEGGRRGEPGIKIFAGQGREQYFVEGFVVAAWTVGCGLAGLILHQSNKAPFAIVRHLLVILAMSMFIVLGLQIFEAYVEKTRWYTMKDTVPPHYWNFLSSSVKKSSGLLKRLVRVSEIFLFDFKDWPGFKGKVKGLVWDYVIRELNSTCGGFIPASWNPPGVSITAKK